MMMNNNSEAAQNLMDDASGSDGDASFMDETDTGNGGDDDYETSTNLSENEMDSSTSDREKKEKQEIEELIKRETRSVLNWRETVTGILMIVGFIASLSAFVFMGREEHNAFESAFHEAALVIANKFLGDTEKFARDTLVLSDHVTATAVATGSTWPFVTVPFFEVYGRHIRSSDSSDLLLWAPVVTEAERSDWEGYATENQGWVISSVLLAEEEEEQQVAEAVHFGFDNEASSHDDGHQHGEGETHDDEHIEEAAHGDEHGKEDTHDDEHGEADTHDEEEDDHDHDHGHEHRRATENHLTIPPYIHLLGEDEHGSPLRAPDGGGPYAPVWQISPAHTSIVNLDLFSYPEIAKIYGHMANDTSTADEAVITTLMDLSELGVMAEGIDDIHVHAGHDHPHSLMMAPVMNRLLDGTKPTPVGMVALSVVWDYIFHAVLPEDTEGVQCVVRNSCNSEEPFTYLLNGGTAIFMGRGEENIDTFYADMDYVVVSSYFTTAQSGGCSYTLHITPTRALRTAQKSSDKVLFAFAVAGIFCVIGIVFHFYDKSVQKRNKKMLKTAAKSNVIVSSLFPSTVKKRLFEESADSGKKGQAGNTWCDPQAEGKPLADFFPEATVLFADIVGFTAWSSVREPSQVFVLLETIYHAFDQIAKRRRIFKIETIGDCYVATAGLPEPRKDHAPAMARFAYECLHKMHELTARLEETLGPDTGDLSMRFGIHSGPVTAGVLRGERSRFQLFGDTVNTAARMESNGKRGRIHISQETANLLTKLGKGHWLVPREDKIVAKGKGTLTTYWLTVKGSDGGSTHSGTMTERSDELALPKTVQGEDFGVNISSSKLSPKLIRLCNWNVEILSQILVQIVARRKATKTTLLPSFGVNEGAIDKKHRDGKTVIDEVEEVITLPKYDAGASSSCGQCGHHAALSEAVVDQLRSYVTAIAESYKDNPFHNFEHASHVTMSVTKLLSRIVAPKMPNNPNSSGALSDKLLHDHTYGITSDPMTQFACVFSALIHDVEHDGVPNTQLVKEGTDLAARYKNQSVAEQNSLDIAWALLMEPRFKDLRATIYCNEEEMVHFRKLIVNCVMATDICDKQLKDLRNKRWDRAFAVTEAPLEAHPDNSNNEEEINAAAEANVNRKATIVIEHLLQASDVSHTMQHWHVFRKWNENLFTEMYFAYRQGRAEKDPATFWYEGEIGFFDFYVIPLAKKLSQCGVFGVSSDEYLNYAECNRNEWEERGKDVVQELSAKAEDLYERVKHGTKSGKKRPSIDASSHALFAAKKEQALALMVKPHSNNKPPTKTKSLAKRTQSTTETTAATEVTDLLLLEDIEC